MKDNRIAIIGYSGIFPDAEDIECFVKNLSSGRDSVKALSSIRISNSSLDGHEIYEIGGYLQRVDLFDYKYFNLSKAEASAMDPTQRHLLQLSVTAIENAGYATNKIQDSQIGVFFGVSQPSLYQIKNQQSHISAPVGNLNSMIAGRISYHLNLQGPAMVIDTACSSSLVAVHQACKSILSGECEYALAGGFKIQFSPNLKQERDDLGIQSEDGKTRSFDKDSSGTGFGEGGGVVFLKSLRNAINDNDNIHAVILGSAVNSDGGRSNGITSPSPLAQEEVLTKAWTAGGIDPTTITYIEAHGTGTKLGDPIEVLAINKAFAKFQNPNLLCAISSVKTNIGHLDNASGIAGLIKAVLSIKCKMLFPTLHYNSPNPYIDFNNTNIYVNRNLTPWVSQSKRRAGVSSFGLSGTNAHCILEEFEHSDDVKSQNDFGYLLKISAKTLISFEHNLKVVKEFVNVSNNDFDNVIYTLNTGRSDWEFRTCIFAENKERLLETLNKIEKPKVPKILRDVVLLISGDRMETEDVTLLRSKFSVFEESVRFISEKISEKVSHYHEFAYNYALFKLLESFGVKIKIVLTTGIGRIINEFISGKISSDDLPEILKHFTDTELNVRKFQSSILELNRNQNLVFLNLGTGGLLSKELPKVVSLDESELISINFLNSRSTGEFYKIIADLYNFGVIVDWAKIYPKGNFHKVSVPTYQFEKNRCWWDATDLDLETGLVKSISWKQQPLVWDKKRLIKNVLIIGGNHTSQKHLEKQLKANFADIAIYAAIVNRDGEQEIITISDKQMSSDFLQTLDLSIFFDTVLNLRNFLSIHGHVGFDFNFYKSRLREELEFINIFLKPFVDRDRIIVSVVSSANKVLPNDIVNAEQQSIMQLYKTLGADSKSQNMICLDLNYTENLEDNLNLLVDEMLYVDPLRFVSYRSNKRFVMSINPILISKKNDFSFYDGKVIVISDNASGNGASLSQELVKNNVKKIIFLDFVEQNLSRERKTIMERISVGKIDYHRVDSQNPTETINYLYEKNISKIDGVFQCTHNELSSNIFSLLGCSKFDQIFTNHVNPTLLVDFLTHKFLPDFFFVCSSLSSIYPPANTGPMAVAGGFLSSLVVGKMTLNTNIINLFFENTQFPPADGSSKSQVISQTEFLMLCAEITGSELEMVPVVNYSLDSIPLNPYFCISQDILPHNISTTVSEYSVHEIENFLLTVWSEILLDDQIKIDDDFFDLGGHSINAGQVLNRANKRFNVNLNLDDLYELGTISKISSLIVTKLKTEELPTREIPLAEKADYYDLSSSQKRIWIISQTLQGNLAYNLSNIFVLTGDVSPSILNTAFKVIIKRHEILRTVFIDHLGEPKQKIKDSIDFEIVVIDTDKIDRVEILKRFSDDLVRPFDLPHGPLLNVMLIRNVDEKNWYLFFKIHHIICDGWSMGIIFKEFLATYEDLLVGQGKPLKELEIQYKDYAVWQSNLAKSSIIDSQRQYWLKKLDGYLPILNLRTDFQRSQMQSFEGSSLDFKIHGDLIRSIHETKAVQKVSTFVLMLSAFKVLLFCQTKQQDLLVGTDFSGRVNSDLENLVGMFINPIVLRSFPSGSKSFLEFLEEVKISFFEANKNQDYQFDRIVSDVVKERDPSRNPIFDVMFVMQNANSTLTGYNLPFETSILNEETQKSQFDISFVAMDSEGDIHFSIKFNSKLFKKTTIELLGNQYLHTLKEIVINPQISLGDLCESIDRYTSDYRKLKQIQLINRSLNHFTKSSDER